MIAFLVRRLGQGTLLLAGISILMFAMLQAAPGEFLSETQLNPQISAETVNALRAQYGLERPLPVRYYRWLVSVAHGDLGYSFAYNMPVSGLLWPRARNTLLLTIPALILSWLVALPLGMLVAWKRTRVTEALFGIGSSGLLAIPDLVIALLVLLIALKTHAFPVGGMFSVNVDDMSYGEKLRDMAWHMFLPVCALALGAIAPIARQVRASMIEALDSQHARGAEAHGLSDRVRVVRYALPAAVNPLLSLFGLSVAGLLSASLLVEVILSWPGMGPLLIEAILSRDIFVVVDTVMFSTLFLVIGNFLADVALYVSDPRIRVRS